MKPLTGSQAIEALEKIARQLDSEVLTLSAGLKARNMAQVALEEASAQVDVETAETVQRLENHIKRLKTHNVELVARSEQLEDRNRRLKFANNGMRRRIEQLMRRYGK